MLDGSEKWIGPFQVRKMLEHCLDDSVVPKALESGSAYLVTRKIGGLLPPMKAYRCTSVETQAKHRALERASVTYWRTPSASSLLKRDTVRAARDSTIGVAKTA